MRACKPSELFPAIGRLVSCDWDQSRLFSSAFECVLWQVPYRLHAVLVHEGQANAGHYWAYIYDPRQHCWMKYNDITVTKSSWEELVRDSFGGYRNASAYCLMYIDDKKPFLIEGTFCRCFINPLAQSCPLVQWAEY